MKELRRPLPDGFTSGEFLINHPASNVPTMVQVIILRNVLFDDPIDDERCIVNVEENKSADRASWYQPLGGGRCHSQYVCEGLQDRDVEGFW